MSPQIQKRFPAFLCGAALWVCGGVVVAEQVVTVPLHTELKPTPKATDLITVGDRTFRYMHPVQYPDNDREFIVDHLFRTNYRKVRHWRMVPGTGCRDQKWQHGYTPIALWHSQGQGSVLTLRGEVEADLAGFASLRVRVLAAKNTSVSVKADIDGKLVPVTQPAPGVDEYGEYIGPVRGKRLHAVEVRFETSATGPVSSAVMWVMLVKAGEPTPIPKLDPTWPGLLVDEFPAHPKPIIGVIFDADELQAIRQELHGAIFAKSWAGKIRAAKNALASFPEDRAGSVVPSSTARYGRAEIRVKPYSNYVAVNLAYVGLIEERPDMLRHAARWALTRTTCKRWVTYGIEALDGLQLSHGRFRQADETYAMALVLDWAGSALTPAGRDMVAKAIHDLGVVDIDGIMHPGSYVWHMNQGLVFEKGRFAGAVAVRKWYPDEYARREADARKMLNQCMKACVKPDGTAMEGPAYWNYTIAQVPALAFILAKASGEPVVQVVPPEVAASARWAWINRRTDTDSFKMLTYSDSGYERGISPELKAFFAGPLQIPEYVALAKQFRASGTGPLFLQCIHALPSGDVVVPIAETLTVFRDSGHVDIRQPDPRNGMRLYFLSGEWGGKSHGDRNSFILEAFGQTLLLDRATSYYTHPLHHAMISAEAHNTVVADNLNQTKRIGKPGAHLLRTEEQGRFVIIESDAAPAWPGLGKKVLRRLLHLRPATLLVEDVVEWERPVTTHQYWQSNSEWKETPGGWVVNMNGVELRVTVLQGSGVTVTTAPYAIDGKHRTVFRLDAAAPKGPTARILTLLQSRPNDKAPWPCTAHWDPKNGNLRLTDSRGQTFGVTWRNGVFRFGPRSGASPASGPRKARRAAQLLAASVASLEEKHGRLLARARQMARKGDFDEAAELVENALGKAESKGEKTLLRGWVLGFCGVQEMRQWVIEGVAAGRHETVFLDVMGKPTRTRIVAADAGGVQASVPGGGRVPWHEIPPRRFHRIAKKYAAPKGEPVPEDRAQLLQAFAVACGISQSKH